MPEKERAKICFAETAEQFISKYKSKKYNADNAGLCVILDYLYLLYRQAEAEENPELPKSLYTPARQDEIIKKAYLSDDEDGIYFVEGAQKLVDWLPQATDSAIAARGSAIMAIKSATSNIDLITYVAERWGKTKADQPETLMNASIHSAEEAFGYLRAKEYIINSMCFLNAYNTFIKQIAAEISIPEFSVYCIGDQEIRDSLSELNNRINYYQILTGLKEIDAKGVRQFPAVTDIISPDPMPIPARNIKAAKSSIRIALHRQGIWSTAFSDMTTGYWQRPIANGGAFIDAKG